MEERNGDIHFTLQPHDPSRDPLTVVVTDVRLSDLGVPVPTGLAATGTVESTQAEDSGVHVTNLLSLIADDAGTQGNRSIVAGTLSEIEGVDGITFDLDTGRVSVDTDAFQYIAAGETETFDLTYEVEDTFGNRTTATARISITGEADAGAITGIFDGTVTEDEALTTGAKLTAIDIDRGEDRFAAFTDLAGDAGRGTFTLTGDGTWSYTLDNALAQSLQEGETVTDTDTVRKIGGETAQITVTIEGRNDAPDIVGDSTAFGVTEGAVSTGGLWSVLDIDRASLATLSLESVADSGMGAARFPSPDFFSLTTTQVDTDDPDATAGWQFDAPPGTFDYLALGETIRFTMDVLADDGLGGADTQRIEVTVTGENDGPVVRDITGTVSENGAAATLTADFSDHDASDSHSFTLDTTGTLGRVVDLGTGQFAYDADGAFEALAAGETATDTFRYTVTDSTGASEIRVATVTITGENDGPVVNDITGSVSENGAPATLIADFSDIDTSDTHTFTLDTTGTLGHVVDLGNGQFDYSANGTFETLAAGETATDSFLYTVTDSAGASETRRATVTITGENDGPVADADASRENADVAHAGNLLTNDSDVDASDILHVGSVTAQNGSGALPGAALRGLYGSLTMYADGSYAYTADETNPDIYSLPLGAEISETFTYEIEDGSGGRDTATLTVTVVGINTTPEAADDAAQVAEGDVITGNVGANDVDPDTGAILSFDFAGAGADGFGGAPDGTWTFDASVTAFDGLAEGETKVIVLPYTVTDEKGASDTATLTLTVVGTNDDPDAADDTGTATVRVLFSGNVLANDRDVDVSDVLSVSSVRTEGGNSALAGMALAGAYGTLTLGPDGAYTYAADAPNPDVLALAQGETLAETFTYTVTDPFGGTDTADLTVTVAGINDAPEGGTTTATVTEGDAIAGSVPGTDPDNGAALSFDFDDGVPAGFTGNSDGSFSFDATAYDRYGFGEGATWDIGYTVTDAFGASDSGILTIVLAGENDAPEASDIARSIGEAAGAVSISPVFSDPDLTDSHSIAVDGSGRQGSVSVAGGQLVYSSPGFEALAAGETATETFTYTVTDQHGAADTATVRLTVTGENDAPVAGDLAGTVSANAIKVAPNTPRITFILPASDIDASDTLTFTLDTTGTTGILTDNGAGYIGYDFGADYAGLKAGETVTDTFGYTVSDGTATDTGTVTVTITGENDAPEAMADSAATDTDAPVTGNVLTNDTDMDDAAGTLAVRLVSVLDDDGSVLASSSAGRSIEGRYGALTLQADGTWAYAPGSAAAVARLAIGETLTETFSYIVEDPGGESSRATLAITLNGTWSAPVASDDSASALEGAGLLTGSVAANDTDADTIETLGFVMTSDPVAGFAMAADGSWSFDQDDPAYDALAAGEVLTFDIGYTVTNGKGATDTATLTLTVTGTNDGPVAEDIGMGVWSASDGKLLTADFADVDDTEGFTWSIDTTGTLGRVTNNHDGTFTFDPRSNFNDLDPGEVRETTFTYTVTDADGLSSTATATVRVTYDAPPEAEDADYLLTRTYGPSEQEGLFSVTDNIATFVDTQTGTTYDYVIPFSAQHPTLQDFDPDPLIQVADVNGDGDDDLFFVLKHGRGDYLDQYGTLVYMENLGRDDETGAHNGFAMQTLLSRTYGTAYSSPTLTVEEQDGSTSFYAGFRIDDTPLVDLIGDGYLDFSVDGYGGGGLVAHLGGPNGFTFGDQSLTATRLDGYDFPAEYAFTHVMDLTGDGIDDLVAIARAGSDWDDDYTLRVAAGDGTGTFDAWEDWRSINDETFVKGTHLLTGSFNAEDGDDVLSIGMDDGDLILTTSSPGWQDSLSFTAYTVETPEGETWYQNWNSYTQETFVAAMDADFDGDDEILMLVPVSMDDGEEYRLQIFETQPGEYGTSFADPQVIASFEMDGALSFTNMELIDMDLDGRDDIVLTGEEDGEGFIRVMYDTGAVSSDLWREYSAPVTLGLDRTDYTATAIVGLNAYDVIDSITADEDTTFARRLPVFDPDNSLDELTFTVVRGPEYGSVTIDQNGIFAWNADGEMEELGQDEFGQVSFDYVVSSSEVATSEVRTVTLDVRGINDAPEVADVDAGTGHEDRGLTGTFAGTDIDNDDSIQRYEAVSALVDENGEVWGTVDISGNAFNVDFRQDLERYETKDLSFDYVAYDSYGAVSDSGTVSMTLEGEWEPVYRNKTLSFGTEQDTGGYFLHPATPFIGVEWDTAFDVDLFDDFTISGSALDAVIGGLNDVIGFFGGSSLPTSITIPGVGIYGSTSGAIGFQPIFSANTGYMDSATVDIALEVGLPPQLVAGESFTGYTGYTILDQGLDLEPADLDFGLDFIIDFAVEAGVSIAGKAYEIIDFAVESANDMLAPRPAFFDFEIEDAPSFTQSDYQIDASGAENLQGFSANGPDETVSVTNEQPLVWANIDVDALMGYATKFQSDFSISQGAHVDILGRSFNLVSVTIAADILDVDLTTAMDAINQTLSIIENYSLTLEEVPIVVTGTDEDGDTFFSQSMLAGNAFDFDVPADVVGAVDFAATVDVDAVLDHVTTLGADIDLVWGVLALGARIESDFFATKEYNVFDDGNAATGNHDGFDYLDTQPVDLFDSDNLVTLLDIEGESVDGFDSQTASFDVASLPGVDQDQWILA